MTNKTRALADVLLNMLATVLPIALLQLLVFPLAADGMPSTEYGLLTTVYAVMGLFPGTLGLALCTIRLINCNWYAEGHGGDFQVISAELLVLGSVLVAILLHYYGITSPVRLALSLLTAAAWLLREYHLVAFRIKIDYRSIVINNALMAAGYAVGLAAFLLTGLWELILLSGQLLSLLFILKMSQLWREPIRKSNRVNETRKEVLSFSLASFLSRIVSYADRILLFPIVGGHLVSVYYVATLVGKILSMAIGPVGTVLLSYLAKEKTKSTKTFFLLFKISVALAIFGYILIMFIARWVVEFLYPQFADKAMLYVPITSASALIYAVFAVLNTFLVKFYSMRWQIRLYGVSSAFFLITSAIALRLFGLYGFCICYLTVNIIQLIAAVLIFLCLDPDSPSAVAETK